MQIILELKELLRIAHDYASDAKDSDACKRIAAMTDNLKNLPNLESIYEIAFGDDAINKGYSFDEVVQTLRGFSDKAQTFDELTNKE